MSQYVGRCSLNVITSCHHMWWCLCKGANKPLSEHLIWSDTWSFVSKLTLTAAKCSCCWIVSWVNRAPSYLLTQPEAKLCTVFPVLKLAFVSPLWSKFSAIDNSECQSLSVTSPSIFQSCSQSLHCHLPPGESRSLTGDQTPSWIQPE